MNTYDSVFMEIDGGKEPAFSDTRILLNTRRGTDGRELATLADTTPKTGTALAPGPQPLSSFPPPHLLL